LDSRPAQTNAAPASRNRDRTGSWESTFSLASTSTLIRNAVLPRGPDHRDPSFRTSMLGVTSLDELALPVDSVHMKQVPRLRPLSLRKARRSDHASATPTTAMTISHSHHMLEFPPARLPADPDG
jgi:hypothetical protein